MEIAGCVTIKAARENGLEAGTPVVTGTDDAAAELLLNRCGKETFHDKPFKMILAGGSLHFPALDCQAYVLPGGTGYLPGATILSLRCSMQRCQS